MSIDAMKQALEALEFFWDNGYRNIAMKQKAAMDALHERLAQPEQEPVAWYDSKTGWTDFHAFKPVRQPSAPDAEWLPLYTTPPPRREWQGLTEEEMRNATQAMDAEPLAEGWSELVKFARAIEAKLKEKNA